MQLRMILLVAVSILSLLSGVTVFFGASKNNKKTAFWFLLAAISAAIWTLSIMLFLVAKPDWNSNFIESIVKLTFCCALWLDATFLGSLIWGRFSGKLITVIMAMIGAIITAIIHSRPELLYTNISITNLGNGVDLNVGPLFCAYVAYMGLVVTLIVFALLMRYLKTRTTEKRSGDVIVMCFYGIASTAVLVANLIMPLFGQWGYVWTGPLALAITIVTCFCSAIHYREINLVPMPLKITSRIVVAAAFIILYLSVFSAIFALLFKGASPSVEVIILNSIMALILVFLFPAVNELGAGIRSLMSVDKIDMSYIVKKIDSVDDKLDIRSLTKFLALHMHYDYIGIEINKKIYSWYTRGIPEEVVKGIANMKEPERGIWQRIDMPTTIWRKTGLSAVAALRGADGKVYGQIILGKPVGGPKFKEHNKKQIETTIGLVSTIIDAKKYTKA